MPIYNIDIEKFHNGEYWTNRYQVNTETIGAARALSTQFVDAERFVHTVEVLFTRVRTSDNDAATDSYFSDSLNVFGQASVEGDSLPHFNRVRVDFTTADGGRPNRKFLLLPLQEIGQTNGTLTGVLVNFVQTTYVEAVLAIGQYCDPQGSAIVGGSVYPRVAMRQLRRASKRRRPVLP